MKIDRETRLFGSFSGKAGSFGCAMHNFGFRRLGINAIYKSFSVTDIGAAVDAMRALDIRGAGVSMPFKVDVMSHLDEISDDARSAGAVNTIINDGGKLVGRNSDVPAAKFMLSQYHYDDVVILGDGGYARAVACAAEQLGMGVWSIVRGNWKEIGRLRKSLVYNCTPVANIAVDSSNEFIDCIVGTPTGNILATMQGAAQFEWYTNMRFPLSDFLAQ